LRATKLVKEVSGYSACFSQLAEQELTRSFDAMTPSSWYVSTTSNTTSTLNEFQSGNWSAVFVFWASLSGQADNFNARVFVSQVGNTSPQTPFFLIVPISSPHKHPSGSVRQVPGLHHLE